MKGAGEGSQEQGEEASQEVTRGESDKGSGGGLLVTSCQEVTRGVADMCSGAKALT